MDAVEPKYGDIAKCKKGHLGLILEVDDDMAYGIHLSRLKIGNKWQSEQPEVVGNIYEYLESIKVC